MPFARAKVALRLVLSWSAVCSAALLGCEAVPGEAPVGSSGAGGAGSPASAGQGASTLLAGASGVGGAGLPNAGASGNGGVGNAVAAGTGGVGLPGWPQNPLDARTETLPAGTVQLGWGQLDIGKEANYDGANGAADPGECPDPDEMKTPGTVQFANGVWTLTGSGEGFIHGWDQGNLVYFKTKISGDFTFTMKVDKFEMTNGENLDGAAEALLNVRQDLNSKQPTHSVIAGAAPSKAIFMARYPWEGDGDKWWHWPAFPATWPDHREILSWTRLVARGSAISAESPSHDREYHCRPVVSEGCSEGVRGCLECRAHPTAGVAPCERPHGHVHLACSRPCVPPSHGPTAEHTGRSRTSRKSFSLCQRVLQRPESEPTGRVHNAVACRRGRPTPGLGRLASGDAG